MHSLWRLAFEQWGYIESLSGTRDLNLPLAYVNRHLCVVATGGNTKGYGAIRAQTISLTQVRLYAYTSEDGAYSHYLSLGYQLQWRNNPGLWAIPFTEFVAGGITMTRTGSQSSGTWYGDSGTISLTGYTASCATNESWVSSISGSAIAVGL